MNAVVTVYSSVSVAVKCDLLPQGNRGVPLGAAVCLPQMCSGAAGGGLI